MCVHLRRSVSHEFEGPLDTIRLEPERLFDYTFREQEPTPPSFYEFVPNGNSGEGPCSRSICSIVAQSDIHTLVWRARKRCTDRDKCYFPAFFKCAVR